MNQVLHPIAEPVKAQVIKAISRATRCIVRAMLQHIPVITCAQYQLLMVCNTLVFYLSRAYLRFLQLDPC